MLRTNNSLVIALTTFNHEFLKIAMSGLLCAPRNIHLVIYNDNPCRKLTVKHIRHLGYRGNLHIINTDENSGLFNGRIAIVEYLKSTKNTYRWIMFANDDDIILNMTVPVVSEKTFAIIGNAVVIKSGLLNVLRVLCHPHDYTIDGVENILLTPHIGMAGTPVCMPYMLEYCEFISGIKDLLTDIVSDTPFAPPTDLMMWHTFIEYMRIRHPDISPIYMNQTNYLMTKLNGTRHATDAQSDAIIQRSVSVIAAALRGNE